jgi:Kef-type K+ transport system membrane component KefB
MAAEKGRSRPLPRLGLLFAVLAILALIMGPILGILLHSVRVEGIGLAIALGLAVLAGLTTVPFTLQTLGEQRRARRTAREPTIGATETKDAAELRHGPTLPPR